MQLQPWVCPYCCSLQPIWGCSLRIRLGLQPRAGVVTRADTPPAASMAVSSGCEAMLPRARAA